MALPPAPAGPRLTGPVRVAIAAVLALAVLVCAGVLAWLLATGGPGASAGSLTHPDEREDVMSLGDQFVKRLGYSPDMLDESGQMPAYRERVREVITPKFATDFDKQVATAEQLVARAGVSRSVEVYATAVSSIDDDSARVLVAGAFFDSYTQGTGEEAETIKQEPFPVRLTVDLVMIDGAWLVDNFGGVTEPGEQGGDEG